MNITNLRKKLLILTTLCMMCLVFIRTEIPVRAEEVKPYEYTVSYYCEHRKSWQSDYNQKYYTFKSDYPVYAFITQQYVAEGATIKEIRMLGIDDSLTGTNAKSLNLSANGYDMYHIKNSTTFNTVTVNSVSMRYTNTATAISILKGSGYSFAPMENVTEVSKIMDCFVDQFEEKDIKDITFTVPLFESMSALATYLETGDDSGQINKPEAGMELPDTSTSIENDAISLLNFEADNVINASWGGISGTEGSSINVETGELETVQETTENAFVTVELGYSNTAAPGDVVLIKEHERAFPVNDGGFQILMEDIVDTSTGNYLLYVKCTPYHYNNDDVTARLYRGTPSYAYYDENANRVASSIVWNKTYDFSNDVFSSTMPVPELTNLSHGGFVITNNDNGYFVDIIVSNVLYGVKHNKVAGSWVPTVDKSWIYESNYYNLTLSDEAFKHQNVDIFNSYGVNPEGDLIEAFKDWSFVYPEHYDLPDYSFLRSGSSMVTTYKMRHVYNANSEDSDEIQLATSLQGSTTYYVRFYDADLNYGQWVRYKFEDGYQVYGGIVSVGTPSIDDEGKIVVDRDGNPIVDDDDEVSGYQDYETGETGYIIDDYGMDISNTDDFFDYLTSVFNSVKSALDAFGSLLNVCFAFLPDRVIDVVVFGIVLMVFIGVVKAVI